MENLIFMLIDLVFENPVVAIVLFAVISLAMNKLRGGGGGSQPEQRTPRPGSMPPFGGDGPIRGGPFGGRTSDAGSPPTAPPRRATLAPAPASPGPSSEEAPWREREDPRAAHEAPAPVDAPKSERAKPATASPVRGRQVVATSNGLHARNAAQGMIWSEVYGPPRALRPHHRSNRRT